MDYLRRLLNRNKSAKAVTPNRLEIPAILLWGAIERAKASGLSSDNCPILGSTIGVARRKAKLTIYELAEKSGQTLENIVDLNLGTLPLSQAAKIAEVIRNILTIDEEEYKRALFADSRKR